MFLQALHKIAARESLTRSEASAVMDWILAGRATDAQIAGLLIAIHMKGESVEELVGFAMAMRRRAQELLPQRAQTNVPLVDTCGTGGDGAKTFNISTCAAFVVAGAGVLVAKHGNRSISSKCGSADVLEALGVRLDISTERCAGAIEEIGIGFFHAPVAHAAMKHATGARQELGMRTAFNLLGPLTNPAGATAQVVGVYRPEVLELMARALAELGIRRGFVVHGKEGMDEISLSGETLVAEIQDGTVRRYTVVPEDFDLPRAPMEELRGGSASENARIIRNVLRGKSGAARNVVLANVSAALVAAGRATGFREGVKLAQAAIDSGGALQKLEALVKFTTRSTVRATVRRRSKKRRKPSRKRR